MLNYKSNINSICPICNSEQTYIINNHLYSNIICKNCKHEAIVLKEQNFQKFANKIIKKTKIEQSFKNVIKNVIEYSYCPYWTLMQLYDKDLSIIIAKKQQNILRFHTFSDLSVRLYAKNILIPNIVTEEEDFYTIEF